MIYFDVTFDLVHDQTERAKYEYATASLSAAHDTKSKTALEGSPRSYMTLASIQVST